MPRIICLVLLVACLWPIAVEAGPPFLTDDPDPVELGHYEAIPFYSLDRAHDGSVIAGPGVDFNYGIFPGAHLNIETGFVHALPAAGMYAFGFGDTRVALKWRFLEESADRPELAIYPAVIIPTGSARRGLGNGQAAYSLPLWIEKNWGAWTSYGGAGYTLNRAAGARDDFYGGWLLQRSFGDALSLGAELFAQGADTQTDSGYTLLNLGGSVAFDQNVSLIFSAGHSFAGASHAVGYLGLYCTWGP
jgi:hypothetical protein